MNEGSNKSKLTLLLREEYSFDSSDKVVVNGDLRSADRVFMDIEEEICVNGVPEKKKIGELEGFFIYPYTSSSLVFEEFFKVGGNASRVGRAFLQTNSFMQSISNSFFLVSKLSIEERSDRFEQYEFIISNLDKWVKYKYNYLLSSGAINIVSSTASIMQFDSGKSLPLAFESKVSLEGQLSDLFEGCDYKKSAGQKNIAHDDSALYYKKSIPEEPEGYLVIE